METSLINSLNKIWPYSEIKICYFHLNQSMEKQRKKSSDLLEYNIIMKICLSKNFHPKCGIILILMSIE